MNRIIKVYKKNCAPCAAITEVLKEVKAPFELEELDIEDPKFAVRRKAKSILGSYATTNIPFLLFLNEKDEHYAAHYYEEGLPTADVIERKIKNGNDGSN